MKLFLIRHGESVNNRLDDAGLSHEEYMQRRVADPPLTELGERQAVAVAQHLAEARIPEHYRQYLEPDGVGYGITRLYCSPMLRAMQTAQPIADVLGLAPQVWVDIHEQGGMFEGDPRDAGGAGLHRGMTSSEIIDLFPGYQLPDTVTEEGWWPGGYEEMDGCNARALKVAYALQGWASEFIAQKASEHIGLVAHGTFMDALIKALIGQLPNEKIYYSHYNTAITRIDFLPNDFTIVRYTNRSKHLAPELLTAAPPSI